MHRPTIPQLEAFLWTADLGSVGRAAEKLNVTQSTVSLRLKQLQAGRRDPLLERHGRGLRPTPHGQAWLVHARLVLDAMRGLDDASGPPGLSGTLRIGLAEGFAVACMPHLVQAVGKAHPLLLPEWTVGTSSSLEESLTAGALDAAVLVDPIGLRGLRLFALGRQVNVWAVSRASAERIGTRPADLVREVVITTPAPTAMHRATLSWFAQGRIAPARLCICSSLNAAMQLVAGDLGIGIFPAKMIDAYPLKGAVRVLATHPPLADGHAFLAERETDDPLRGTELLRLIAGTTGAIDYFPAG